jgi:SAM-dependent methyltransferase
MTKPYLNLGCGCRFHPDWENVDFIASAPAVRAHNLRKGIPFPDSSFDVVYHSHLLEHFPKRLAPAFLRECHRVLKPRGTIRVAVPDLERIARAYLEALENAFHQRPGSAANYDWMILEMYDQTVREHSGGSCGDFFRQEPIPNWDFIVSRLGAEAKSALAASRAQIAPSTGESRRTTSKWLYIARNLGSVLRNKIVRTVLTVDDREALQVGRFRRQGEIHQWMYDSYSLARLLGEAGFFEARQCTATLSRIPNWTAYGLDSEPDGTTYKPDSLFMEAIKL